MSSLALMSRPITQYYIIENSYYHHRGGGSDTINQSRVCVTSCINIAMMLMMISSNDTHVMIT